MSGVFDHLYSNYTILASFLIPLVICYLITPVFKMMALKLDYVDHPQKNKKSHNRPTPLLGGLAIFVSFLIGILFTTRFEKLLIPLLLGAFVLVIFGLIDDKYGMMPNVKMAGQIIAALILIRMGIKVDTIQDHYLSLIFTVFWVVGITNAMNLLDNLNGLSSGIAGISALFFGIIAWQNGQMFVSTISLCLAGACFGFLKHNFPRAKIFMGDVGSMTIGFILSAIAIMGCWKTEKISISLSLPILILSYPIFDTTLVTIIRRMEGRSIFEGGRDHSSHILSLLGLKKKRAVLLIYIICLYVGFSAYLMSRANIYASFAIMGLAYLFLIILGIYLISVRLTRTKRLKANGRSKK